jgi:hypothetical protein
MGPYILVESEWLVKHAMETLGPAFWATTLCSALMNLSFDII